MTFSLLDILIH